MTPTSVLFFAAGLGTRMAPLTNDRPKPLVTVAGKSLLAHAMDLAETIPTRVVNVHYLADQIIAMVDPTVIISDERDALLETGGGLKKAAPLLSNPTFTMNTDAVWSGPNPFDVLREAWRDEMDALLLTCPKSNAVGHLGHGDFVTAPDGRISRGPGNIYTGAQIIRTDVLQSISETAFSLNEAWNILLERGTLFGVEYTGKWCDVGRPDSIPLAEEMVNYV